MGCGYDYYDENEHYFPRLRCKLNDGYCMYSKKCLKQEKFIPIEGEKWRECYLYNMEREKNIPVGSNYIQSYRPNRNGYLYLYVVIGDSIEKILSEFKEINQDYVYLKEDNGKYRISLTPFRNRKTKE